MALFREELDRLRCQKPGCKCGGNVIFHAQCHPASPTWLKYDTESGEVVALCGACKQEVVRIVVAARSEVYEGATIPGDDPSMAEFVGRGDYCSRCGVHKRQHKKLCKDS